MNIDPIRSRLFALFSLLALALFSIQNTFAAECGIDYEIKSGDSLSSIALDKLDDHQKWTAVYNANIDIVGDDPNLVAVGTILRIPCLDAEPVLASSSVPTVSSASSNRSVLGGEQLRVLTADDYQPFTDRSLPEGGLISELVNAALTANNDVPFHTIGWINDWAAHLDPLLAEHAYDMGFPWLQPNCADDPENYRCLNFLFSEPMFEMLVLLFTNTESPLVYGSDDDIVGKTLCRPEGYYTHDLEKNGRLWLTKDLVKLNQPSSIDECFRLLTEGEVDAVAINEFTGRTAIKRLELEDKVSIIDTKPLSIEGLHVLVHKQHPFAGQLINTMNESLKIIQGSGSYQKILDRHLAEFWKQF